MPDPLLQVRHFVDSAAGPVLFAAQARLDHELSSRPHRHARGQLLGSLGGLLSVGVEDGMWVVPAIHAVWLPPGVLHSGRSHGPFHGWSLYLAGPACADLPRHACTIRISGLLREAVQRASGWTPDPRRSLEGPQARLAAVILDEIRGAPVEAFGLPLPRDPRLLRIARALVADPADGRGLEAWARWAAIGSRTLSRRFVAETGFNFTAWRQRARLMHSLELLAADLPVTTIALDLGYSTASAFIGLFRPTFGATPAAWRAARR